MVDSAFMTGMRADVQRLAATGAIVALALGAFAVGDAAHAGADISATCADLASSPQSLDGQAGTTSLSVTVAAGDLLHAELTGGSGSVINVQPSGGIAADKALPYTQAVGASQAGDWTFTAYAGGTVDVSCTVGGGVTNSGLESRIDILSNNDPDTDGFHGQLNGASGGGGALGFAPDLSSGAFSARLSRFASAFRAAGEPLPESIMAYADPGVPGATGTAHAGPDIWIEGRFGGFGSNLGGADTSGKFAIGHIGIDHLVTDNILLGVMATVDYTSETTTVPLSATASGWGWMAGPYLSAKLSPNLYLDLRAAWGQSDNTVSLAGDPGSFGADRWLVKGELTGSFDHGSWTFSPVIGASWVEEFQKAFTTAGNTSIAAARNYRGQVKFGPKIAYRHELANGTVLSPYVSLTGLWSFAQSSSLISGVTATPSSLSATLKGGVTAALVSGATFGLEGSYGGIFASDYESWSARAKLSLPLN